MLRRKVFGVPLGVLILSLLVIVAVGFQYVREQGSSDGHPQSAQQSDSVMAQVTSLTSRIMALADADSNASSTDQLRIDRLELMNGHRAEIELYLSEVQAHPTPVNFDQYLNILRDYLLLAVGPVFSDPITGDGHEDALTALSSVSSATSTDEDADMKAMDREGILDAVDSDSFVATSSPGFFTLDDRYNSGAYNIFMAPYSTRFENGRLIVSPLTVIDEYKGSLVILDSKQESADDELPYSLTNAHYDAASGDVIEYGMLPFGQYPCNGQDEYAILPDRLIHIRSEIPTVCIGKDIESPDDLSKYFKIDEMFDEFTTTYSIASSTYERAVRMDLSTATP